MKYLSRTGGTAQQQSQTLRCRRPLEPAVLGQLDQVVWIQQSWNFLVTLHFMSECFHNVQGPLTTDHNRLLFTAGTNPHIWSLAYSDLVDNCALLFDRYKVIRDFSYFAFLLLEEIPPDLVAQARQVQEDVCTGIVLKHHDIAVRVALSTQLIECPSYYHETCSQ
nr:hypothetical transcript [Hymenolepis microstoma]